MELILLLIGGVGLIVGIAVWQKKQVGDASVPQTISFAGSDIARSRVDSVAVRVRLDRTGWNQRGDDWVQALYPSHRGRDPFRIDITVAPSGSTRIALVSEGASQETYMGFIPTGPVIPHGTEPFLRYSKQLKESMGSSPSFSGGVPLTTPSSTSADVSIGSPLSSSLRKAPSSEALATMSREILETLHGGDRLTFERLDARLDGELMATLAALSRLVARGDVVREPGGFYRIIRAQESRS